MPHIDLSTTTQAMAGMSSRRTFAMKGGGADTVVMFILGTAASQSSGALMPNKDDSGAFFLSGTSDAKMLDSGAAFVGYVVKQGSAPSNVWVDADVDAAVGPSGLAGGIKWDKPADDATAATLTAEHVIWRAPAACTISAGRYLPDGALTSSDTTYKTLILSRRDSDGTNAATAASVATKTSGGGGSGDWAANVAVPLTLGAAVSLTAGQQLTVQITKASTGVVVKSGTLQIDFA